ncbi:MAG TPA: DUF4199 family protein [Hymenobacter sp.]|uniref:DUF4199 family protein n=1 Tax=Hymenobacter sp. TaxID=1898978 RepID=UPI002D80F712|nr:DUF4199 family protein [Hymenobacter sp.]HET9503901.1 DUF4199 family protein [Hymenobacter sp.]
MNDDMVPSNKAAERVATASGAAAVRRLGLQFGLAAGAACALWLLFLQLTDNNPLGPKQLMGQLLVPMAAAGSQWLLRRTLAPARPGVGRALAVGGLTVLVAAALAAGSLWGLARSVGEPALARNRTEMQEIVRVQQAIRAPEKRNAQFEAAEMREVSQLTVNDLTAATFKRVLLLGLLGALPAGIFLRK